MSPSFNTVLQACTALGVVLGLILLTARAARWLGLARPAPPRSHGQARLVAQASLPLDRLRTVHVVRCDGRDVVLLTGGTTDVLVGWLPEAQGPTPHLAPGGAGA